MRRPLISLVIGVLAVPVVCLVAMAAPPPEEVTVDDCVAKKSAVIFKHKAHGELTPCSTCHHTQEALTADSGEAEKCSTCHIEPEKAETPKCSEMSTKKNPFHLGCISCHKDAVAKDASVAAPTKCDGCHPKA